MNATEAYAFHPQAKRRAVEVVRHHRLIETFLFKVLDYPLEEVHDEASVWNTSSQSASKSALPPSWTPQLRPHGHVIPTMDGQMAEHDSILLTEVEDDGTFIIDSVSDRDPRNLRYIESCD